MTDMNEEKTRDDLKFVQINASSSDAEIIETAAGCFDHVKATFSDPFYADTETTNTFSWMREERFRAFCSIIPSDPQRHEIGITYYAVCEIYREALRFPVDCERLLSGPKYNEVWENFPFGDPRRPMLPRQGNNQIISERMAKSVLTWVYLHEQCHLFQCHGEISRRVAPSGSAGGLLVEDVCDLQPSSGSTEQATLSHLFELSADHEATRYTIGLLAAAEGGQLPKVTLWCFISGLTCLFNRFFGYRTERETPPYPCGTHPEPSYRMSILLRGMTTLLNDPEFRKFAPWADNPDEFQSLAKHAIIVATLFCRLSYSSRDAEQSFLAGLGAERKMPETYTHAMIEMWCRVRPMIEEQYFGLDKTCIFPMISESELA